MASPAGDRGKRREAGSADADHEGEDELEFAQRDVRIPLLLVACNS